jgi:lipopolysaccharide transport system permease protein
MSDTPPPESRAITAGLTDYLTSVWNYRHMIKHFAASDLRNRFRGSYFGALWLLINPLIYSAIFVVVFGAIFGQPVADYAPYVLSGVVLWEFISNIIGQSTQSILAAEGYLKQKRIPLLAFCLRTLVYHFVCLLIGISAAIIVAMIFAKDFSLPKLVWLIPALALLLFFCAPLGIISAVANTRFRDYSVAITHLLTVLYYTSPIFIIRKEFERPQLLIFSNWNPITALCDVFRAPLLYGQVPSIQPVWTVFLWSALFWIIAIFMLKRSERNMIFYF